jgi:K+-transporting ATPase ATPase A chain
MLLFSLVSCLFTYVILRVQHLLPLNPQGFGALSPDLAFNTATSFTTNTNWQSYTGESTMSYLSQMVALVIHNFTSAATGIAIAAALVRGLARHSTKTLGNFWVDLVRTTYYLLVPICTVFAVVLVSQGMIQNFKPYTKAKLTEPYTTQVAKTDAKGQPVTTNIAVMVQAPKLDEKGKQVMTNGMAMMADVPKLDEKGQPVMTNMPVMVDQRVEEQAIVQGPMASQVAIKMLGTNGGGYTNANAAHPFENPSPLSNFLQMLSIFAIGSGLTYYLGRMVKNQAHGWSVWAAMMALFLAGVFLCWYSEAAGNPIHHQLGVAAAGGNMEGKEVRFGIFNSALFATVTTDASCGAVNSMHDSFTALGGFVPLFNIQLGEIIFGGVGAGLYGMLVFVVLAVFIAGLMVGRTPEYLGQEDSVLRCEDVNAGAAGAGTFHPGVCRLGFDQQVGAGRTEQQRPARPERNPLRLQFRQRQQRQRLCRPQRQHPLVEHHHRPGDAGRPVPDDRAHHGPGRVARPKRIAPPSAGTFPVSGFTFVVLLIGTVLLVGALNFLPGLTLGPIVEHFLTAQGKLF